MAITQVENNILWSTASSVSVTSATEVVSDAFIPDATCVALWIQVSADNAGTPASGDTAVFRVQKSTGDILGDTGNDYDTSEHAEYLVLLDTVVANTPGEDPARRTVQSDVIPFKLAVTCANAATRNMTIRARVVEQRAA